MLAQASEGMGQGVMLVVGCGASDGDGVAHWQVLHKAADVWEYVVQLEPAPRALVCPC